MPNPPARFKALEDLSVDEHLEYARTGKLPESDEYLAAVRKAHEKAGLEPPDEPAGRKATAEMTADDHFEQMRRRA